MTALVIDLASRREERRRRERREAFHAQLDAWAAGDVFAYLAARERYRALAPPDEVAT